MNPKHRSTFWPPKDNYGWRSLDLTVTVVCRGDGSGSFINTCWNGAPQGAIHLPDVRMGLPEALNYLATLYQLEKGD